jgi:hypothetical protein
MRCGCRGPGARAARGRDLARPGRRSRLLLAVRSGSRCSTRVEWERHTASDRDLGVVNLSQSPRGGARVDHSENEDNHGDTEDIPGSFESRKPLEGRRPRERHLSKVERDTPRLAELRKTSPHSVATRRRTVVTLSSECRNNLRSPLRAIALPDPGHSAHRSKKSDSAVGGMKKKFDADRRIQRPSVIG